MINPYQELYEKVFQLTRELGYDVYDYLPDKGTSYPFVFVGEQIQQDQLTKTKRRGTINIVIHVFHRHKNRKECQEMVNQLFAEVATFGKTAHFRWHEQQSQVTIMFDNTDSQPLVHGVLDMTLEFA